VAGGSACSLQPDELESWSKQRGAWPATLTQHSRLWRRRWRCGWWGGAGQLAVLDLRAARHYICEIHCTRSQAQGGMSLLQQLQDAAAQLVPPRRCNDLLKCTYTVSSPTCIDIQVYYGLPWSRCAYIFIQSPVKCTDKPRCTVNGQSCYIDCEQARTQLQLHTLFLPVPGVF
jgi:hypothetical protein